MKNISVVTLLCYLLLFSLKTHAQTPLQCGVDDRQLPDSTVRLMGQLPRLMADQRARKTAGERRICRVAVEIDSDTYLEFEKDTNRIRSYVLNQLEIVSKIYEREINTQLVVVYVHIWKDTEPDPYRGELNINVLHSRFRTVWDTQFKQISSDKRLYLPTKAIYGAGGLGDLGGVYATAYIGTYVIAHELGHNFGSPHTQSCTWPGGPIDFCSTSEGTCYTQSLQDITGTVMSYCSKNSLSFHPLCQTLMTDHAVKNFTALTVPDKAPVLAPQLTLSGTPFLYWNGQPQAERYDIDVATDAGFTQKIISDTTLINGYDMSKLTIGQAYYVRVRSTNKFGVSNWSAVSQLQRATPVGIVPPILLSPAYDQRLIPYNNAIRQFSVQPVSGATAYEVQITSASDYFFKYPLAKTTSPTASFTLTSYSTGTMLWRVRTVANDKISSWSSIGRFVVNPAFPISLPFSINEPAPLSFPFSFYTQTNSSTVKILLSTDSLFTKPTYEQTVQNSYSYTGMLDKLQPGTDYYIRLEETNTRDPLYPIGTLSKATMRFKTGNVSLSQRWSFVNSGTNTQWPQGTSYDSPIVASGNYVWSKTQDGPIRIHQDSLTTRLFDRNTTNGKIGNLSSAISGDGAGNVWVTNRTSINIFKNGFAVPYYQMGKISGQAGDLTEITNYGTGNTSFSNFTINPRLFYNYDGIYEQKADSLTKIYSLPANHYLSRTLVRPGVVWMIQYNYAGTTPINELVQFNTITRTTKIFSADNTPQLRRTLSYLATDGLGNLWVSQSEPTYPFPPLAKFDGQNWTAYDHSSTVPIFYVVGMTNDQAGNLYVFDSPSSHTLYKFDGIAWKKITDMPLYNNLGNMSTDNRGNIWFTGAYQLMRFAPCPDLPTPKLTATKKTLEVGESVTLQATGCTDVLWSWSSETETVNDRLVRGTNQLTVKPDANTIYRSRCYDGGCTGVDTTISLTVLPKLTLSRLNKIAFCHGDSLTASYTLQGKVAASNQFSFILKSSTQTTIPALVRSSTLSMIVSSSLTPGRYTVYIETTQPVVRARDSIQISVSALPTAELSSNKLTFPLGDSARISVALTGLAPWKFTRWDALAVQTSTSPYQFTIRATQPTNYSIALSGLSDANCATGTIKNSVVVSALALANEPVAADGISVYPNPVTSRLTIEVSPARAPLTSLRLRDSQGREVGSRQPVQRTRRDEWDISTLPTGQYILFIETSDGKQASWKVVKQ